MPVPFLGLSIRVIKSVSCSVTSDFVNWWTVTPPGSSVHGILQTRILLQGTLPSQVSNLGLLHCRRILYRPSHLGSPGSPRVLVKSPHKARTDSPQTPRIPIMAPQPFQLLLCGEGMVSRPGKRVWLQERNETCRGKAERAGLCGRGWSLGRGRPLGRGQDLRACRGLVEAL